MKHTDEHEIRRRLARERILGDAWALGFPILFARIGAWFAENRISFGIFMSGPVGAADDPIGRRFGFFTADSPRRILVVGWARINRSDLVRLAADRRVLRIRVFGWLRITEDVDGPLASTTLSSVRVTGLSRMPSGVRETLAA